LYNPESDLSPEEIKQQKEQYHFLQERHSREQELKELRHARDQQSNQLQLIEEYIRQESQGYPQLLESIGNPNPDRNIGGVLNHVLHRTAHAFPRRRHEQKVDIDNMDYDTLIRRFGTGDENRRVMDSVSINQLPTHKFVKRKSTKENVKILETQKSHCSICLEEFKEGENVRTLPCFHYYHPDCIDPWLKTNLLCPVCKNPSKSFTK